MVPLCPVSRAARARKKKKKEKRHEEEKDEQEERRNVSFAEANETDSSRTDGQLVPGAALDEIT